MRRRQIGSGATLDLGASPLSDLQSRVNHQEKETPRKIQFNLIQQTLFETAQPLALARFLLIPLAPLLVLRLPQARAVCQEGCGTNASTFLGDLRC
jgi:hypothetical protein